MSRVFQNVKQHILHFIHPYLTSVNYQNLFPELLHSIMLQENMVFGHVPPILLFLKNIKSQTTSWSLRCIKDVSLHTNIRQLAVHPIICLYIFYMKQLVIFLTVSKSQKKNVISATFHPHAMYSDSLNLVKHLFPTVSCLFRFKGYNKIVQNLKTSLNKRI